MSTAKFYASHFISFSKDKIYPLPLQIFDKNPSEFDFFANLPKISKTFFLKFTMKFYDSFAN